METQPCPLVYIWSGADLQLTVELPKGKKYCLVLYRKSLPIPAVSHHLSFLASLKVEEHKLISNVKAKLKHNVLHLLLMSTLKII